MDVLISQKTHRVVCEADGKVAIIENNQLLVQDISTESTLFIPLTKEVKMLFGLQDTFAVENEDEEDMDEGEDTRTWTPNSVLFLILEIEKAQPRFENGLKKNVWTEIAKKCSQQFHKNVTYSECDSKWKSLKRTYKSILLHNSTSGKERKRWEYFDVINNFMAKKPEIQPVATCSSIAGLKTRSNEQGDGSGCSRNLSQESSPEEESQSAPTAASKFQSSFTKKRKARESATELRHRDKMARQDRFNDLFKDLVDKL